MNRFPPMLHTFVNEKTMKSFFLLKRRKNLQSVKTSSEIFSQDSSGKERDEQNGSFL